MNQFIWKFLQFGSFPCNEIYMVGIGTTLSIGGESLPYPGIKILYQFDSHKKNTHKK